MVDIVIEQKKEERSLAKQNWKIDLEMDKVPSFVDKIVKFNNFLGCVQF